MGDRDPQLRTADDYNLAIAKAISGSAVFLAILSPAYENSPYCKQELAEFRRQSNPGFGLTVGTLSRMQAMLTEPLEEHLWPAEVGKANTRGSHRPYLAFHQEPGVAGSAPAISQRKELWHFSIWLRP